MTTRHAAGMIKDVQAQAARVCQSRGSTFRVTEAWLFSTIFLEGLWVSLWGLPLTTGATLAPLLIENEVLRAMATAFAPKSFSFPYKQR